MLGRRRTGNNMPAEVDPYSQRLADSESIYNADMEPPATSYASARTPLNSRFAEPTVRPKTGAAFMPTRWRLNGIVQNWAWGGTNMGLRTGSLPGVDGGGLNGHVRSTDFQTTLVQLHDWSTNTGWFQAGWNGTGSGMFQGSNPIRYEYPAVRVSQINTSVTGGAGPNTMRMGARPRYTRVQTIQKYTVVPSRYNTRGA